VQGYESGKHARPSVSRTFQSAFVLGTLQLWRKQAAGQTQPTMGPAAWADRCCLTPDAGAAASVAPAAPAPPCPPSPAGSWALPPVMAASASAASSCTGSGRARARGATRRRPRAALPCLPRPAAPLLPLPSPLARPSPHSCPVRVAPTLPGGEIPSGDTNRHGKALLRPARAQAPAPRGTVARNTFSKCCVQQSRWLPALAVECSRVTFPAVEVTPLVFMG